MHYCLHEAATKVTAPSMMPGIAFVDIKFILHMYMDFWVYSVCTAMCMYFKTF